MDKKRICISGFTFLICMSIIAFLMGGITGLQIMGAFLLAATTIISFFILGDALLNWLL